MNMHPDGSGSLNGQSDDALSKGDHHAAKGPHMTLLNQLQNKSSRSLFLIVHKILDDIIKNRKEDVPDDSVSCLKKLVQIIEQRSLQQAEHLSKFKTREEQYQSKIRALTTMVTGAVEENKAEKTILEKKKRLEDVELVRLRKENAEYISEISKLNQELEMIRDKYRNHSLNLETHAKEIRSELETKMAELEKVLTDSKKKERGYKKFMDFQQESLKELSMGSESIKQEVLKTQQIYSEEIIQFGVKIQGLVDAAQNYHSVLTENIKLYNEVQDLKGKIRVYCRIRPFLKDQNQKQTTIEHIGDNGELAVTNPSKIVKQSHRSFKFTKVFGPASTQEEVFADTQPLIRSVLDGYNVCIFAYGQTGSGKTYTMTGPNVSSPKDWGVNYRALNDLFHLSQIRSSFEYEISVQMIEIYNENVRDLLSSNSNQPRLEIFNCADLAVPNASMHTVTSTADVLELMNTGLMNRAVGATALNERSSRSHSVLTVHVRGTDLGTKGVLRGMLHLIDLAGSERADKSEATGDRLKETQNINKSLSALGDVFFALAHKKKHVPYRNSKLTKILQSSLGGQAKTLMFVQLNPDVESFSETISTLEFAKTVSGVELGAARSSKEGSGVRDLMDQSKLVTKDGGQENDDDDLESIGLGDADSDERLSDISDGVLRMGTDRVGSLSNSLAELALIPETTKAPTEHQEKPNVPSKLPRPPPKTTSSLQNQVQPASTSQKLAAPSPQRQGLAAPSRPSVTKGGPLTASSSSAKKSSSASSCFKSGARR